LSRDEYFLRLLKLRFGFFEVKSKKKSSAFFYETITSSENLLTEAGSGFPVAGCDSKVVPKAACDSENCSESRL
jgi:hypothetical protein